MGGQVQKIKTPWATPAPEPETPHYREVCVNMDAILFNAGIDEPHVRRRLTAHAIVACGWRQCANPKTGRGECYNYNAWKCKIGSDWDGDWFVSDTIEEKDGKEQLEQGTKWRSYPTYGEALADHRVWHLKQYAAAKAALLDPSRPDRDYAQALKDGRYFTSSSGVDLLSGVCARVAREMSAVSDSEILMAREAMSLRDVLDAGADDTRPFPLLLVCAGLAVVIGAALVLVGAVRMKGRRS